MELERRQAMEGQMIHGAFIQLARAAISAMETGNGDTFIVLTARDLTVVKNEHVARQLGAMLTSDTDAEMAVVVQLIQLSAKKPTQPAPQAEDEEFEPDSQLIAEMQQP